MHTTTEHITLGQIVELLRDRDIDPDADYIADAGAGYGYVAAWQLPDTRRLIQYGDNGSTNYALHRDADDLHLWLLADGLDACNQLIQRANILGEQDIDEADQNAAGDRIIISTHYYYGPEERSEYVADDYGKPRTFGSHAAAAAWIEETESRQHVCSHNESGAPSYKIVAL